MPKMKLRVTWTEVSTRTTDIVIDVDNTTADRLEQGYGFFDAKLVDKVREVEGDVEMLHDEVDYVEVINRRVRSKK
jgi:hypothetical protein